MIYPGHPRWRRLHDRHVRARSDTSGPAGTTSDRERYLSSTTARAHVAPRASIGEWLVVAGVLALLGAAELLGQGAVAAGVPPIVLHVGARP